jgi:hypothetical protein
MEGREGARAGSGAERERERVGGERGGEKRRRKVVEGEERERVSGRVDERALVVRDMHRTST